VDPKERLDRLLSALPVGDPILILPHNDPDPDAIAGALGLEVLLTEAGRSCEMGYGGIVGRAENRALVRYLGQPMHRLALSDIRRAKVIALVDTQPAAGNNLISTAEFSRVQAVLDHHPLIEGTERVAYSDVRPEVGASSTMITEYLRAAGLELSPSLATALFYGIETDTMGLGRGATPADTDAYFFLHPRVDPEALAEIQRAQVPPAYFQSLRKALDSARVYESLAVSFVGEMTYPDLAAEIADLLLRLEGIKWVLTLGVYKGGLILAARSRSGRGGSGRLVRAIVEKQGTAGGHGAMAGGQIALEGQAPERLAADLTRRALVHLKLPEDAPGEPLLQDR
jgi:nanoRNase/pAp phosphatase (c-di-AMP/oligoRNAs hydrolase)